MKNYHLLLVILLISLLGSCTKDTSSSSNNSNTSNNSRPSFPYPVSNVQDITLINDSSVTLSLTVNLPAGAQQQPVKLVLGGLPANVSATPDSISGTPAFSPSFVFSSVVATPGTYPMTITATTAGFSPQAYNFNLIVTGTPDYAALFAGSYNDSNSIFSLIKGSYPSTIRALTANTVSITNIDGYGDSVTATINDSLLTIPEQALPLAVISYSGFSVSTAIKGSGTLTGNQILMKDSITYSYSGYNFPAISASAVLTKQ